MLWLAILLLLDLLDMSIDGQYKRREIFYESYNFVWRILDGSYKHLIEGGYKYAGKM